jgi:tetratricopeptide (TPR) repeat protein
MANIAKWSFIDGFRLARSVGRNLPNPAQYTAEEFIVAAEKAAKQHPTEWVVFFALGDKYQEVGRYADALRACKRCVELRSNDIRSTYALATAYNLLTRAAWPKEIVEQLPDSLKDVMRELGDILDPQLAHTELDKVGIAVETAATQAIRWFERSLVLNPDKQSRAQIEWDLETLYKRFPHLQR